MQAMQTDVVIIGAGPVGLFQVFELGLQGLKAVVIDSLDQIGGQCSELYPDKPIYDIPAIPRASAREIIQSLERQAAPFDPIYLLGQRVENIVKLAEQSFIVSTDKNMQLHCKAVVIAGGSGSFEPVRLKVADIEQFENDQLHYRIPDIEKFRDQSVVILGGGDSAVDWALSLQKVASSVLLIHRSLNFRASQSNIDKVFTLCDQLEMQFLCGQITGFKQQQGRLTSLTVSSKDGVNRHVEVEQLVVFFGLSPKPGPIASWGLKMQHHQVCVDTDKYQSSVAGIYAVGDVNYYPGKRKLILSGFHEAALAAFAIAGQLAPNKRITTLYTTTSPIVHRRMGILDNNKELEDA
ncbi:MAG: NAD(P)/FAD-dependent oxidoreductase [Psychrobium sp.]|nr:NAD(P)/FAD-dependent oxidoreductase [Psychrobium sp.]